MMSRKMLLRRQSRSFSVGMPQPLYSALPEYKSTWNHAFALRVASFVDAGP